jgi:hypothetical protein
MQCFFQLSEAFFQKWTKINVHFSKIVKNFWKNHCIHSFSIRPPNIRGVTFMLLNRRTHGGHVQTIMLSLYKIGKKYNLLFKIGGWLFYKRWAIIFSTSFIIIWNICDILYKTIMLHFAEYTFRKKGLKPFLQNFFRRTYLRFSWINLFHKQDFPLVYTHLLV